MKRLLADDIVLRPRNVLITPDSAFNTWEAAPSILGTTGPPSMPASPRGRKTW